jgi:hypothetical protein
MFKVRKGSKRIVILTKKYAIKIPRFDDFEYFLAGALSNVTERRLCKEAPYYFCPILFSIPGLLIVMPKVKTLENGWPLVHAFMFDLFDPVNNRKPESQVARQYCEYAYSNYGMYKGKVVAIDYGTYVPYGESHNNLGHYKHLLSHRVN